MPVTAVDSSGGWAAFFWTAFERSANPMAVLDLERSLLAVNDGLTRLSGYSADELVGKRADMLVAPEDWRRLDPDWNGLLRTGRLSAWRDFVRADGSRIHVQFAAQRETVTGRNLVLYVVLHEQLRPLKRDHGRDRAGALTPRELEVVREVAMGRRAHEIATALFISTATVQTHIRNAMAKVGARSQAQLVAIVIATGMLAPAAVETPV